MKCPRCDVPLHITDRQNIEIDFCPECRGVWLDRGELDKILEKALKEEQRHYAAHPTQSSYDNQKQHHNASTHDSYSDSRKKRKPWIMELFD
ncbi:zf-TFIIB domain-containing protein [Oleidesulfovibrio sp.]|uniref:TFIIB-type zinc ribbon-containing protein n=1 Tax=Oleidesulfovibrio sp. TaxID=2909707 RepID=UPI003A89441A